MNLSDMLYRNTIHAQTIAELKIDMQTRDYSLKREIDNCPDGRVVRRTMELPSRCTPRRADLCFVGHDGRYAMIVDRDVFYYGTNPDLFQLFRDKIIVFDSWDDLTRFWQWLPYVD